MAKLPAFAKAFAGRWRIVEMDVWDKDFLDLVETAHLTFKGAADGEIAFGALKGFLDVRYGTRDGSACAEFSWDGNDENDPASGRGWVVLGTAGRLVGHFYIHNGDDSGWTLLSTGYCWLDRGLSAVFGCQFSLGLNWPVLNASPWVSEAGHATTARRRKIRRLML
jgi:hypothetical protein